MLKKKLRGKGVYQDVVNVFSQNKIGSNEWHPPLLNAKSTGVHNFLTADKFLGPGTDINKKLYEAPDLEHVGKISGISKRHDIAYNLAQNKQDIRDADWHMVKQGAKSAFTQLLDNPLKSINSAIGTLGILGKIGLETIGVNTYQPGVAKLSDQQRAEQKKVLDSLTTEGYGQLGKKMRSKKTQGRSKKKTQGRRKKNK